MPEALWQRKQAVWWLMAAMTLALAVAGWFADNINNRDYLQASRLDARQKLELIQNRLHNQLVGDIQLVKGLVSLISLHPNLSQREFTRAAAPLFGQGSSLRNIGAAPDMVIRFMYPVAGNEAAIGLDYRAIPDQFEMADKARTSGQMVLTGPVKLVQGGLGMIARFPVFLGDDDSDKRFWGLISAVIDVEQLYTSSGIIDSGLPLDITIRDVHQPSQPPLFGSETVFAADPVQVRVPLPGGEWLIAATPSGGWPQQADDAALFRLKLLAIILAIMIVFYLLLRTRIRLGHAERRADIEKDRLLATLENTPNVAVQWYDGEGRIRYWNRASENLFGWSSGEALGKKLDELNFTPGQMQEFLRAISRLEPGGASAPLFESEVKHRDGSTRFIYSSIFAISGEDEPLYVSMNVDISERKRVENALRIASTAFETHDAIIITDEKGQILSVNSAFTEITGYSAEEAIGKRPSMLASDEYDQDFYERMWKELIRDGRWKGELIDRRKNGELYHEELTITAVSDTDGHTCNYVGVFADISEKKVLEKQLRHAQKMEAVGTLVSGLAHEFNNMLGAISGNIYLALSKTDSGSDAYTKLKGAEQVCFRAADMIKQLLVFARKDFTIYRPQPVDMGEWLEESFQLVRPALSAKIGLTYDVGSGAELTVSADPVQLQQILMNLVNNARDACEGSDRPEIAIELAGGKADGAFLRRHKEFRGREFVRLSVRDNGTGIETDQLERIFEPFYSTKEVGKGTGLGLGVIQGLVQALNGCIEVESSIGKGTSFSIFFPRLIRQSAPHHEKGGASENTVMGHGEMILLADDEKEILDMSATILEGLGYRVLRARNGREAVELFELQPESVNLLLLDVVMPVMGGDEAARRIRALRPDIPVIFCSGYSSEMIHDEIGEFEPLKMISKPFMVSELSRAVNEVLK